MKASTIAIMLVTLLNCGCSKHGQPSDSGTAASSAASRSGLPGSAPWSGHVLRGDDANALRNYLRTVQEVKATVFQVQWNPATVAIDREAAIRSLRRVTRDGVTFVFAADEPAVQKLKPGSIMWVRDLALRKVDAVNTQGGLTTVQTSVVSLNEAMPNARIEFEAPVPVQNFLLSHREFPPPATTPPTSSLSHRTYGFVPALYTISAGAGGSSGNSADSPPPGSAPGTGNAPGGGTPNAGSTPGGNSPIGGAANVGSATGGAVGNAAGSPNTGSAPADPMQVAVRPTQAVRQAVADPMRAVRPTQAVHRAVADPMQVAVARPTQAVHRAVADPIQPARPTRAVHLRVAGPTQGRWHTQFRQCTRRWRIQFSRLAQRRQRTRWWRIQ